MSPFYDRDEVSISGHWHGEVAKKWETGRYDQHV